MACNCKRKIEIEEKYGEKVHEDIFEKSRRVFEKFLLCVIIILVCIVTVPSIIFAKIYKFTFFGTTKVKMPKFLSKFVKKYG